MDIDDALERAKPFGRTQIVCLTTTGISCVQIAMLILSSVFIAEVPPHHCAVCSNCTIVEKIPVTTDGGYSKCEEFVDRDLSNDTQDCSGGWQYESEIYGESIVTEWDLVCNQASLASLSQSIFLLGLGLGSVFSGVIADKYGRRPITIVSLVIFNALGVAVAFSPNYTAFVLIRFLTAFVFRGVQLPTLVTMFEYLTPRYRPTVGNMPGVLFTIGALMMSLIGYLVRDWRYFHLTIMAPSILAMVIIWLQPESVRWLTSRGRYEEAELQMQKVAKFNRAEDFPSPALKTHSDPVVYDEADLEPENVEGRGKDTIDGSLKQSNSLALLFKPPTLMVTLVMSWLWISYTLIYFGFALSTGNLAGDPYVNFFLSSLVELPARLLGIPLIKRYGNLPPLIVFNILSGICLIIIIVVPDDAGEGLVVTSFALLGKFLIVCTFPPMYLLGVELFPTTLRTAGTGITHLIGNIGSITSPILLYLDNLVPDLSLMVMTAAAFLSALLGMLLPETNGSVQPETVEDLKVIFDTKRLFTCEQICNQNSDDGDAISLTVDNGMDNSGFDEASSIQ